MRTYEILQEISDALELIQLIRACLEDSAVDPDLIRKGDDDGAEDRKE